MSFLWKMPRVSEINSRLAEVNGALALLQSAHVRRVWDDGKPAGHWPNDTRSVRSALKGSKKELELQLVRAIRRHKGKAPK